MIIQQRSWWKRLLRTVLQRISGMLRTAPALLLLCGVSPVLAAGKTLEQYLAMDLAQLMEVTIISVAKRPQTLADTAAAVFVISQEDIRRTGVTSIPEALAMAPGLQVARISASRWSISSRGFAGFTSNKLLVLIVGQNLLNSSQPQYVAELHTPLTEIQRGYYVKMTWRF